jgi:hypothetical protein
MRDSQQRIEPAAIADDVTLCETQATTLITNSIDIDAGREKIRTPVAHDARDQEGRFCSQAIISGFADHRLCFGVREGPAHKTSSKRWFRLFICAEGGVPIGADRDLA